MSGDIGTSSASAENEVTVERVAASCREGYLALKSLSSESRNRILEVAAVNIEKGQDVILAANRRDLEDSRDAAAELVHRLKLTGEKLASVVTGLREVAKMPNPLGRETLKRQLAEGLVLSRVCTPIGVICVIFEARPEAGAQIAGLCIKTGNGLLLKGGKEAQHSNRAVYGCFVRALQQISLGQSRPEVIYCLQLVESRHDVEKLLSLDSVIDLVIPRGGRSLVNFVKNQTKIPILAHSDGICCLYAHTSANDVSRQRASTGDDMAHSLGLDDYAKLILDSKLNYPAACNALEVLLADKAVAAPLLEALMRVLHTDYPLSEVDFVLLRSQRKDWETMFPPPSFLENATFVETEADLFTEHLCNTLSIHLVTGPEEAMKAINRRSSHHTDGILAKDKGIIRDFQLEVDSASVFANCSTRFADGFRYGFGAEVGISTGKIHARGPVGLDGLLSYKYLYVKVTLSITPPQSSMRIPPHERYHPLLPLLYLPISHLLPVNTIVYVLSFCLRLMGTGDTVAEMGVTKKFDFKDLPLEDII